MSIQKVKPKDLLSHFDIDAFVKAANNALTISEEEISQFVTENPEEARELLYEAYVISQLEMILEEGNKQLKIKKGKQANALKKLCDLNSPGLREVLPEANRRKRSQ